MFFTNKTERTTRKQRNDPARATPFTRELLCLAFTMGILTAQGKADTTWIKVEGHSLPGENHWKLRGKPDADDVVSPVTAEVCAQFCEKLGAQCKSFDYYQSTQGDSRNRCDLSLKNSGDKAIRSNDSYQHFCKVGPGCQAGELIGAAQGVVEEEFTVPAITDQVESYRSTERAALIGHNDWKLTAHGEGAIDFSTCAQLCDILADNDCKSFDYHEGQQKCELSKATAANAELNLGAQAWDNTPYVYGCRWDEEGCFSVYPATGHEEGYTKSYEFQPRDPQEQQLPAGNQELILHASECEPYDEGCGVAWQGPDQEQQLQSGNQELQLIASTPPQQQPETDSTHLIAGRRELEDTLRCVNEQLQQTSERHRNGADEQFQKDVDLRVLEEVRVAIDEKLTQGVRNDWYGPGIISLDLQEKLDEARDVVAETHSNAGARACELASSGLRRLVLYAAAHLNMSDNDEIAKVVQRGCILDILTTAVTWVQQLQASCPAVAEAMSGAGP